MASASSKKVIYAALAGNFLIALTKFIAFFVTQSSAMLSEGVHSVVDTSNQVLLLYGLRRAKKPADAQFPFGHGKEVYFWGFIVAIMIFTVGAGVSIYKGIHHLLHPVAIQNPTINYVVLASALLFEGAAWYFALTEFTKAKGKWGYFEAVQRGKDPSIFVVLFEDSAAMLGILVALLGIFLTQITGNPYYDGIASVVIGLILAACSGNKSIAEANACKNGLSQAYSEFERAEADGFGGAVDMTKAGSLLSAAKIQEQFEKYPNCIDKVERARYYIAKARGG